MIIEYVMFLALFSLVGVTAVKTMNSGARSYFSQSSSRVGQPINRIVYDANGNRQQQQVTTTVTAAPATTSPPATTTTPPATTTTTTTTPPTTTTTPPTTTTAAPTTTTTSTTTTTTTTTTTPATTTTVAQRLSTSLSDISDADPVNSGRWRARVRVTLAATGGASVNGISLSGTFTRSNGATQSASCTTSSGGTCILTWSNRGYGSTWIDFDLTSVVGGAQWTGSTSYLRVYAP